MLNRRPELFWLLTVGIVLLLAVWWIPGSTSVDTDSYSVAFGGKKVLYQVLRRLDQNVSRSFDQLVPEDAYARDRILILGPARYPTEKEWDSIYRAVIAGHSVVFAAQHGDPQFKAGLFGVEVVSDSTKQDVRDLDETAEDEPTSKLKDASEASPDSESPSDKTAGEPVTSDEEESAEQEAKRSAGRLAEIFQGAKATSRLLEGEVAWRSAGKIKMNNDDGWDVLVEVDSEPQAVQRKFGSGTFTLVASDDIFSNGAMTSPQRALLAWRLIESTATDGETLFDETLNSSGVPKVFGILFDPLFRPITLQFVLIAMLFGWMGSRRFGPARRSLHTRRRSVVEHAEAVGALYYRAGAGPHAVNCLHEFLKHELRTKFGATIQVDNAETVARQTLADKHEVQELFDSIRTFSTAKRGSTTAARLLKRLSCLLAGIRQQARKRGNQDS
ncbi:MAG: hypothetical protein HQ518_11525 [Rhodopirellula sp.]|nr:hypothetical protein [Rhodopirellula sp.]